MSKLWGSRFEAGSSELADLFSFSISYDKRLAKYDVQGSIAHARMLGVCEIIPQQDAEALIKGLQVIGDQLKEGTFIFDEQAEDIHTNIQQELKKIIGDAADKLHTARSRNDLIVLDMRLYCIDEINQIIELINALQQAILKFATANQEVIIPAYTHLQAAQVVLLSHHMLAYIEMLERDKSRLIDTRNRMNILPLGSCALSGTSLPIDRKMVAHELGFNGVSTNSIDAVSDRDFVIETISSIATVSMHFSRFAEDLITWATAEFNVVDIDWSLCTGSSIMPHKKNPDICELIRGETASIYANLQHILVLTKGLPLTYNRDLQLDKPPLFNAVEKIKLMIQLLGALFSSLKIKNDVLKKRINQESFFSVDLMEYLIKAGVSYRDAHDIVGKMFKECVDQGISLSSLDRDALKSYSPHFDLDAKKLLNPHVSVRIKKSFGSTNPTLVKSQLQKWKRRLKD